MQNYCSRRLLNAKILTLSDMIQGRLNLFQPQGSDFGFYSGLTLNQYGVASP
ncbi:hypothetical protein HMPREF9418_0495 [Neisseria macacae ATCC 33926]|uniref:Uncharacterized protein n=1 Tax=Neisseria macacae ATCC 33926 TaxID=997348 RepID=A0AA36ULP9_9NEIS|nr:hypothetical protein HMPREF9418_0495 [Neisseria macacae ATCC 33926]